MNLHYLTLAFVLFNLNYYCKGSPFPPTNSSWFDIGPVVLPTEPWEGTAVQEPQVYWDVYQQEFRMYYRGGWGNQSVGVATSKTGITWKKYEHNPIYGSGGSNIEGLNEGGQPFVFREGIDKYWLYTTAPGRMNIAISEDGYTWTTQNSTIKLPDGCTLWGNRVVWTEQHDVTNKNNVKTKVKIYYMLQDSGWRDGVWKIFLYTSNDSLSWQIGNYGNELASLQIGLGDGMFGGVSFANINGTISAKNASGFYNLWYHASPASNTPTVLPTDIYHAASKDLITWKISLCESPVLKHSGKGAEYDQTADPSPIITPDGGAYLYYDGDNNVNGHASIGMAIAKSDPDIPDRAPKFFETSVTIDLL
jgi:hypothetical protein